MFIAALGGAVVVGAIAHGDYSDYSDDYGSRNHREYGDSALREQISSKKSSISNKESTVDTLRQNMNNDFNSRINELKREKNYSGLNSYPEDMISKVKNDMRRELDEEIARDKQELAEIDQMIARINELELQAKR